MTGGRGVWSLETVLTSGEVWSGAAWQRDNVFATAIARGHSIIVRIQPNWGENVPFPEHYAQFLADAQIAAQELAGVCHVWQIGNEPNLSGEWGGNVLTAAQYATMYRDIRAAIRSVSSPLGPQIVLVAPASPGEALAGVRHTAGNDWLRQVCENLALNDVDGFGLHGYGAPWNNATNSRNEFLAGILTQLAILDTKGYDQKPAFVTEWARAVDPIDPPQEAISAQFLAGSLADMAAWNALSGAHPATAMCWFIYPADSGAWQSFSIESLRSVGPAGAANDLFDAFTSAAAQNYPATWPAPSTTRMLPGSPSGANAARSAQTIITTSSGNGALAADGVVSVASKWTSSGVSPPHWLQLDFGRNRIVSGFTLRNAGAAGEQSGFNTEAFAIQSALDAGGPFEVDGLVYNFGAQNVVSRVYVTPKTARFVRLYVVDAGIDNFARVPEFEVYTLRPVGDMDNDGDVDLADWNTMRFCFHGPDADYPAGNVCRVGGDADGDADLDMADVAAFQRNVGQY